MRSHAPFEPTVTKFCVWGRVGDVITDAKFYGNRLKDFGVTGPLPFPILNVQCPYNSVNTTVLQKIRGFLSKRGVIPSGGGSFASVCKACDVMLCRCSVLHAVKCCNVMTAC